ncbi:hypothetical protein NJ7G_2172 [Natrinema sp. J7-2]|nr:hypothetical protein NJ7G_2172 [Natrinema sp. J7-2]
MERDADASGSVVLRSGRHRPVATPRAAAAAGRVLSPPICVSRDDSNE